MWIITDCYRYPSIDRSHGLPIKIDIKSGIFRSRDASRDTKPRSSIATNWCSWQLLGCYREKFICHDEFIIGKSISETVRDVVMMLAGWMQMFNISSLVLLSVKTAGVPTTTRWQCELLSRMEWVRQRFWKSYWRILAWWGNYTLYFQL